MPKPAGEVHSIRLPSGAAAELKRLSGQKVSTVARTLLLAYIERLRHEQTSQTSQTENMA